MNNQNHSLYFIAKCFAAYYGCAMFKNGTTSGITGTVIDSILKFGTDGWLIKLMPLSSITEEHARRILEMRTKYDLTGAAISLVDNTEKKYVSMEAVGKKPDGSLLYINNYLDYGEHPHYTVPELEYLKGQGYDVGFSHVHSLIDEGIAINAAELNDGNHWNKSRVERGLRDEVIANLTYCVDLAKAANVPPAIGLLQFVLATFQVKKEVEMFQAIGPVVIKLSHDIQNEHRTSNN